MYTCMGPSKLFRPSQVLLLLASHGENHKQPQPPNSQQELCHRRCWTTNDASENLEQWHLFKASHTSSTECIRTTSDPQLFTHQSTAGSPTAALCPSLLNPKNRRRLFSPREAHEGSPPWKDQSWHDCCYRNQLRSNVSVTRFGTLMEGQVTCTKSNYDKIPGFLVLCVLLYNRIKSRNQRMESIEQNVCCGNNRWDCP